MRVAAAFLALGLAAGCTEESAPAAPPLIEQSTPVPTATQPATQPAPPERSYDVSVAMRAVRHLAGDIGPRQATSPAFREAADWVADQLERTGYDVHRQRFAVPGGVSWGVPVAAGRSQNVVATEPGFDPTQPHLVVGAHLDTVPQAPGAEDNATGVGVLLALARTDLEERLPVVLVAFGAEEPRGPTDAEHHFGSRHYVASMSPAERQAVRGMLSLDRVGVGSVIPVGSAGESDAVQRQALRAAERAGVPARAVAGQRSSDHWSFVRAGLPGARIGSTPYAGYHSAGDVPSVVNRAQLDRVGRLVIAWLRGR